MKFRLSIAVAAVVTLTALGSVLHAGSIAHQAPTHRRPAGNAAPSAAQSNPQIAQIISSIVKARKRFTQLDTPTTPVADARIYPPESPGLAVGEILSLSPERQLEEAERLLTEMLINLPLPDPRTEASAQEAFERAVGGGRELLPLNTGCHAVKSRTECCQSIDSRFTTLAHTLAAPHAILAAPQACMVAAWWQLGVAAWWQLGVAAWWQLGVAAWWQLGGAAWWQLGVAAWWQ